MFHLEKYMLLYQLDVPPNHGHMKWKWSQYCYFVITSGKVVPISTR